MVTIMLITGLLFSLQEA